MTSQRWMTLTAILSVSVPAAYRFPQRMHPFQKGRPTNHGWGGGASSEKYAITQLITPGKRLVPLLSWVTYFTKKKKRHFATRSTWIILLCSWLWNGMGWGKLKMCNVRWINISQMTGQNLQPTADKTKRNTQNPNTVYEYTMLTTDAWIPFLKHRRTDRNNFHWYDINSHRGAEPFFKS